MELLNCTVLHKSLGAGTVVALTEEYITVQFTAKKSIFEYPKCFIEYLRCTDPLLQEHIHQAIVEKEEADRKAAAEREAARRQAEAMNAKSNVRVSSGGTRKSTECNLAFKCNYCDGGSNENSIGYKDVCSDDQIRYNIEVKRHSWCSSSECACCQYLHGEITREELEDKHATDGFVCYESSMLISWTAAAGEDLNENGSIHHGRRIQDAASDSLAILTTRRPEVKEEDRVIFAVFITGQADEGNELYSGYVVAKDDYKIELTPEEANKLLFWHYHKNTDGGARWSQGLYRYMKDTVAARILADIVQIKTGDEKEHAQKVLQHYCELKGLDINNIPKADGAK